MNQVQEWSKDAVGCKDCLECALGGAETTPCELLRDEVETLTSIVPININLLNERINVLNHMVLEIFGIRQQTHYL